MVLFHPQLKNGSNCFVYSTQTISYSKWRTGNYASGKVDYRLKTWWHFKAPTSVSWWRKITTQISRILKKMRKMKILKLKRTLTSMAKLRRTLISVSSSLLMMTRTLSRKSFVCFHVSFKKKNIWPLENFGCKKFQMLSFSDQLGVQN